MQLYTNQAEVCQLRDDMAKYGNVMQSFSQLWAMDANQQQDYANVCPDMTIFYNFMIRSGKHGQAT